MEDKQGQAKKQNFWTTLPGILTGCAAIITAIGTLGGLITVLISVVTPPEDEVIVETISLSLEEWESVNEGKVTLYVSRINDNSIRLRSNLWEDEWIEEIQNCEDLAELEKITCERNADKGLILDEPLIVNQSEKIIEIKLVQISTELQSVRLRVTIE